MTEQEIYDYLYEKWMNDTLAHTDCEKVFIEKCVRDFVDINVNALLYREFDVNDTGDRLFGSGFFEEDLRRALIVLETKLNA